MNLPDHRRISNGRTFGSTWRATDSDPIRYYPGRYRIRSVLLATGIAIAAAVLLFHWLAK